MAAAQVDEIYSRKVLVENIPDDVIVDLVTDQFEVFGRVFVHWPYQERSYRPKEIAYLMFDKENSVRQLIAACVKQEDGYFFELTLQIAIENKKVKIQPWILSQSEHTFDPEVPIDFDKAIYVNRIQFPITAELFGSLMAGKYGSVIHCSVILDRMHKYPTDCAVLVFKDRTSYVSAVADGKTNIMYKGKQFCVHTNPYMSSKRLCMKCNGVFTFGEFAPFFCTHIDCLVYICEYCHNEAHNENTGKIHHISYMYNVKTKKPAA